VVRVDPDAGVPLYAALTRIENANPIDINADLSAINDAWMRVLNRL
jgi:hypothetical protein